MAVRTEVRYPFEQRCEGGVRIAVNGGCERRVMNGGVHVEYCLCVRQC